MGQFSVEKPVAPGSVLSGNQHPDAEFIRKQPFAWRAPGIIIEVGFVEMLREGEGWRKSTRSISPSTHER